MKITKVSLEKHINNFPGEDHRIDTFEWRGEKTGM